MSDLGDRMDKIFTGRDGGEGQRPTVREIALAAREEFGSGRKAAKAMGMAESTFRGVVSGRTKAPKPATVSAFERIGRVMGTRRISNDDIRIPVTPKVGHGRERELRARNLRMTDPKAADRIRDAYIRGGKEEAAKQVIREIHDEHYRQFLTPDQYRDELGLVEIGDYGYNVA